MGRSSFSPAGNWLDWWQDMKKEVLAAGADSKTGRGAFKKLNDVYDDAMIAYLQSTFDLQDYPHSAPIKEWRKKIGAVKRNPTAKARAETNFEYKPGYWERWSTVKLFKKAADDIANPRGEGESGVAEESTRQGEALKNDLANKMEKVLKMIGVGVGRNSASKEQMVAMKKMWDFAADSISTQDPKNDIMFAWVPGGLPGLAEAVDAAFPDPASGTRSSAFVEEPATSAAPPSPSMGGVHNSGLQKASEVPNVSKVPASPGGAADIKDEDGTVSTKVSAIEVHATGTATATMSRARSSTGASASSTLLMRTENVKHQSTSLSPSAGATGWRWVKPDDSAFFYCGWCILVALLLVVCFGSRRRGRAAKSETDSGDGDQSYGAVDVVGEH